MNTQYHLKGRGFSGRAVRLRELGPADISDNLTNAAKLVGPEATLIEMKKIEWTNGVKRMLAEISEACEDPLVDKVKWKKVSPADLDDLGSYFKAKDVLALEAIFRENYEVVPSELAAITGKAVPVSEG